VEANSDTVLAEHNPDVKLAPASITKILTAYILFSQINQGKMALTDMVDISQEAAKKGGSKMFIRAGSQISLEDLLKGMLISSGNDASIALAEHVAGSEESFSDIMNETAAELGMTNSNFMNATGWPDDNHYSTAKDIAKLSKALIIRFPTLYKIFSQKKFTYGKSPKGIPITQSNRNGLLWVKSLNADGIKTGHTNAAGYCLVGATKREDMRLISVVLQTESKRERVKQSKVLLNFGIKNYRTKKMFKKDQPLSQIKVWKGSVSQVGIGVPQDAFVTVKKFELKELSTKIQAQKYLVAPLKKHQEIGTIQFLVKGVMVGSTPLVVLNEVPEAGFFGKLLDSLLMLVL